MSAPQKKPKEYQTTVRTLSGEDVEVVLPGNMTFEQVMDELAAYFNLPLQDATRTQRVWRIEAKCAGGSFICAAERSVSDVFSRHQVLKLYLITETTAG
jgi:hypothetical protein